MKMKLLAQAFYLYNLERISIKRENIVLSRVCTLTPFFLNLYSRLSRLLAISYFI